MYINFVASGSEPYVQFLVILRLIIHSDRSPFNWVPLELLQDSDSSLYTIAPHWSSSYPEYLSPDWDKNTQRAVVWTRLQELRHKLASQKPSKQTEQYHTLCQEFQKTQVESSHKPSSCDRGPFLHFMMHPQIITQTDDCLNVGTRQFLLYSSSDQCVTKTQPLGSSRWT